MWIQKRITLPARPRGFHLITQAIVEGLPELEKLEIGLLHILLQHTSAALTINENADPSVRQDFETVMSKLVPENEALYRHNDEGPDDLPAHIKSSLLGCNITIPVSKGRLNLGIWQGIYLCEFRNNPGRRSLLATIYGKE